MPLIYVAGLSGSGKSTLVALLRAEGYEAHDADQGLCQWINNETSEAVEYPRDAKDRGKGWQERHSFIMSERSVQRLATKATDNFIFICGIVSNDLELAPRYFANVLFLYISKDEMVKRVTARTNNHYGHDADQLAIIKKWYQPTVDKYRDFGAAFIDAEQPRRKVLAEVISLVKT